MNLNRKTYRVFSCLLGISALLSSCVYVDLCEREHPHAGQVDIVFDWSNKQAEAGDVEQMHVCLYPLEGGDRCAYDLSALGGTQSIAPGNYIALAVNTELEQIDLSGLEQEGQAMATLCRLSDKDGGLQEPGWLHAATSSLTVHSDETALLTFVMQQQSRQIIFIAKVAGEYEQVEVCEATLSGVATQLNIPQGTVTKGANGLQSFRFMSEESGRFISTIQVLGTDLSEKQLLNLSVRLKDKTEFLLPLNLSSGLLDANRNKNIPLVIEINFSIHSLPSDTHKFVATINDWKMVDYGDILLE